MSCHNCPCSECRSVYSSRYRYNPYQSNPYGRRFNPVAVGAACELCGFGADEMEGPVIYCVNADCRMTHCTDCGCRHRDLLDNCQVCGGEDGSLGVSVQWCKNCNKAHCDGCSCRFSFRRRYYR